MKSWLKVFVFLWIFSCLTGCGKVYRQKGIHTQLVQRVEIRCENCQDTLLASCDQPEKVRLILLTIRKLGPDFPAGTDTQALAGRTLTLTLHCADGSRQTYRIRNNQYLQKNDGPWRKINAEHAGGLYQLLLMLSSDSVENPSALTPAGRAFSPALRDLAGGKN